MRTKSLTLTLTMTLAALFCLAVNAHSQAVMDPPHDPQGCLTCHDMSAYTEPSMIPGATADPETTFSNVCLACHNGVIATEAHTHSSANTSATYGVWSIGCSVCHNQHSQQQPGGGFIRSNVNLSQITIAPAKSGYKPVVFTGPASYADGDTNRNGICEVCHTQTTHFRNDGSLADEGTHIAHIGQDCMVCHIHGSGFKGSADHSAFIADDNETGVPANVCSGCHNNYATNPDTAHSDCTVCHAGPPTLLNSTFPTYLGQPDSDGDIGTMFANLTTSGYTAFNPILDGEGDDITALPAGAGAGAFQAIKCGFCHIAKPDALAAAIHGGHAAGHFAWDGGCADCHGGVEVVKDVHANDCDLCHTGGTYNASTNGVGPAAAANGIDGDAGLAEGDAGTWTSTCTTCHAIGGGSVDAASLGGIHHDNGTIVVPNGLTDDGTICATCHSVLGHEGNHTARVAVEVGSCSVCHTGTNGTATGIPVNAADVKVHDACGTCHQIAAPLPGANIELVAAPGTKGVTTMNPGTAATNDGGGTCTQCHTAYAFTDHTHNHTTVTTVAPCSSCHTGNTISDASTHINNCADCHNTTSGARVDGSANAGSYGGVGVNVGDATVNGGAGGTCAQCHSTYFNAHTHNHTLTRTAECATCHNDDGTDGSNATNAVAGAAPWVNAGEVHAVTSGGNSCAACHNVAVNGALKGSALGAVSGASCVDCHITTALKTWTQIHTADIGTGAGTVDHSRVDTQVAATVGACDTCHGNPTPVTSEARDAQVTPFTAAGDVHAAGCGTCHDGGNDGGFKATGGMPTVTVITAGVCTDCHTAQWDSLHSAATVSHNVTTAVPCSDCHTGDTITAATMHINNCADCHNLTTGARVNGAANATSYGGTAINVGDATVNGGAGGDCIACHDTYFNAHRHTHNLVRSADCGACHNENFADGNARNAVTGQVPWTGTDQVHAVTSGGNACEACHNLSGGQTSPALKSIAVGAASTADCVACHLTQPDPDETWVSIHEAAQGTGAGTVDHTGRVSSAAACETCHGNLVGTQARDAINTPFVTGNQVHNDAPIGEGCRECHNTNGALRAASSKTDQIIEGGTCITCHTNTSTWLDRHLNATVDHSTYVAATSDGSCETCHTNTGGNVTIALSTATDRAGQMLHNACTSCHDANTGATTGSTTYGGGDIAAGNCKDCHSPTYFDSHVHGTDAGYISHVVTYVAGTDISQVSMNAGAGEPCATCHVPTGLLTTWNGIRNEHDNTVISPCTRCHGYTDPGDGTPPNYPVGTIGTRAAATCATCHTPKIIPLASSDHGGHVDGDFDWTGATTTSCGAAACHDQAGAGSSVYLDIHGNGTDSTCGLCHINPAGGGPRVVNPNADATVGTAASDCTVCHNAGTRVTGGIHHDTVPAATNSCATCHWSGRANSNHNTYIADNATCNAADCHQAGTVDSPAYQANLIPNIDPANPMTHNACRTCHTFNASTLAGELVPAPGTKGVTAMPTGGSNCIQCHVGTGTALSRVDFHHANPNTTAGNCDYCHVDHRPGTGFSTADVPPVPTHLMCEECHVNPESKTVMGTGNNVDTTNNRIDGYAGTDITVRGYNVGNNNYSQVDTSWDAFPTKTVVHTVPDSANYIDNWGICITCHDGTATSITGNTARQVNPMHALPLNIDNANGDYCWDGDTSRGVSGVGAALPGRRAYNNISNINYFGDQIRPNATRDNQTGNNFVGTAWNLNQERCGRDPGRQAQYQANDTDVGVLWTGGNAVANTTEVLLPNPWTGTQFNNPYTNLRDTLPILAAEAAATDVIPSVDIVGVTSADWDGVDLVVVATTSGNCTDLTLETGAGNIAFNGACQATIAYAYPGDGYTCDVTSSQPSVDVTNYPITDNATPTPASAVNDALGAAASGATDLFVLANDGGTNLTVTAIGAVSKTGGAGTCGTIVNNTNRVTYTGGGGDATCEFTYDATSGDIGGPSTATVTVTQTSNAPPAFGSPTYNATPDANVGAGYTSTSPLNAATDPESDPITYSRNGGTCGVWATVAGADGAISGTPVVGDVPNCTVILRATATGGFDEATVTITVNNVTPFTDYTMTFNGEANQGTANTYLSGFGWTQGSDFGTAANGGCFYTGTQQPGSGTSLATMGNPIPFIYRESSTGGTPTCGGYTNGDSFWLESGDLDASTYDFTLSFDYLYESDDHPASGTAAANQVQVWYRNGSGGTWTKLQDVLTATQGAQNAATWTSSGALDYSAVLNQAQSRIRIQIVSATAPGSVFAHDIGLDNITVNGTP